MKPKLKIGKLSATEKSYIASNADSRTVEEIADHLARSVDTVRNEIAKLGLAKTDQAVANKGVLNELHASVMWREIQLQFTEDELSAFEHYWLEMFQQFKEDVWFTEKMQIRDYVTQQIFSDRNLASQAATIEDIKRLEKLLEFQYEIPAEAWGQEDRERVFNLENQLAAAREANESRQAQYLKLNNEKQKLLQNLKGTRRDRIDKIANSKTSFVGLMRLMEEEKGREAIGRETGLANLAADRAADKMRENFVYDDKTVDRPFLEPEHVQLLTTRLQEDDVNIPKNLGDNDDIANALADYLTHEGKEKLFKTLKQKLEQKDEQE